MDIEKFWAQVKDLRAAIDVERSVTSERKVQLEKIEITVGNLEDALATFHDARNTVLMYADDLAKLA